MHQGSGITQEQEPSLGNGRGNVRQGTINNMTALHHPITAKTRRGEVVKIVALGDVEGFSPSCWLINEQGEIDLAPTDRFTVIDTAALPPSSHALQQLASGGGRGAGGFSSSKY